MQSPVFVGRRDEVASLVVLLDRALEGEPGFAIVAGEAGVGKTRLVAELAVRAAGSGFTVLTGHCVELGAEGLPLAPLIDALRTLARTTAPGELAEVLGPARRGLGRLLPELDPGAASAQNLGEPAADGIQVSQLLELVLGLLSRLSARRPLLLVLEDLHWADQSTRELVAFLIRSLRGARVVLLATYRSDELNRRHPLRPLIASWERLRSVQHVELRRFEPREVAAQLSAILAAEPAAALVDLVFDRRALVLDRRAHSLRDSGREGDTITTLEQALALLPAETMTKAHAVVLSSLAAGVMRTSDMAATKDLAARAVQAAREVGAAQQEADAPITLGLARCYLAATGLHPAAPGRGRRRGGRPAGRRPQRPPGPRPGQARRRQPG